MTCYLRWLIERNEIVFLLLPSFLTLVPFSSYTVIDEGAATVVVVVHNRDEGNRSKAKLRAELS